MIDNLLEKYFNGETSLGEEQHLKAYFTSGEVAENHRMFVPLFRQFELEKGEVFPAKKKPVRRYLTWWVTGVAASLILAVALLFPPQNTEKSFIVEHGNKKYDEELALQFLDKKLNLVAQQLNGALAPMQKIDDNLDKNLKPIRDAEKAVEILTKY